MAIITTDIQLAIEVLQEDDIIGLPTETVYGLAGNIYSEKAIDRIYAVKKRPSFNPLIVHLASADQLDRVARNIPEAARALANVCWPGPLTLILEKQDDISTRITAGKDTVAVRVPAHTLAQALLRRIDFPLAAPSANPFKSISPTSAGHVYRYFKEEIRVILDGGPCEKGIESTIIGFEGNEPVLYRHGAIAIETIEAVVGRVRLHTRDENRPDAPGMLLKHYSPRTQLLLSDNLEKTLEAFPDKRIGLITFFRSVDSPRVLHQVILSPQGQLAEAMQRLYAAMHELDALDLDLIIAEMLPEEGLGRSLNDRLRRAAHE